MKQTIKGDIYMSFRSHTKKQVLDAQKAGKHIFYLDTFGSGEDDILIAESDTKNAAWEEVCDDVLSYYNLDTFPTNWKLELIDYKLEDDSILF